MTVQGTMTLLPGTYILQGGMVLSGGATVTGNNVLIYNANGAIDFTGGSTVQVTPPSGGPYAGVSFFQARDNTVSAKFTGGLNGSGWAYGMFYLPNAVLSFTGNANFPNCQLITFDLLMTGASAVIGSRAGPSSGRIELID